MIIAETSFSQAVDEFQNFLGNNDLPTEILWVYKEDVYSQNVNYIGNELWIKLPLSDKNENLTAKQYKIGQAKNLGICLTAFAKCEDKICCHLMITNDDLDSQYMLMSNKFVKYAYTNDMPIAKAVRNSFRWKLFKLLPLKYKEGNYSEHLQSKKNLQFFDF